MRDPERRVTVGELIDEAKRRFAESASDAASRADATSREATLLLAGLLGETEARLFAFPETNVPRRVAARFDALVRRRLSGEPVAYLLGEREFFGRAFAVDDRVLIPRPETEHLVEAALRFELPEKPRILDIGTGSGAIAITLAAELPEASVVALDLSLGALTVARSNARRHEVTDRVRLVASDLATALDAAKFDLVVSNPPYIAPSAMPGLTADVTEYEPHLALTAGEEGTAILRRLAVELEPLDRGTAVLVEIGHDQETVARHVFEPLFEIDRIARDYAGHPRLVVAARR